MKPVEQRFLEDVATIDAEILKAANGDASIEQLDQLGRRKANLFRDCALKLIELGYPQVCESWASQFYFEDEGNDLQICPLWIVTGVPSKKGRPLVEEWMRNRQIEWDGGVKSLREEVENALLTGESVPRFGLRIQLTVLQKEHHVNQVQTNQLISDPDFTIWQTKAEV
jgi:hypothetical protein